MGPTATLPTTFRPRVQSRIQGIAVVGSLQWRAWRGAVADLWRVDCAPGACGEYLSPDPRLFVVLDCKGGGNVVVADEAGRRVGRVDAAQPLCFVPADVKVSCRLDGVASLTHLDVHLDLAVWRTAFEGRIDAGRLRTLRLAFADQRVLLLARLLATECVADAPAARDLYGDGLCLALAAALFETDLGVGNSPGGLSPRQLRLALDFLNENALRNVRLDELARLVDLSPAHFSRAFKLATGMPPHRWQMHERVKRAKAMLGRHGLSLPEIAAGTGFCDQAHMTRVFRQVTGATPGAWRAQVLP